MYPKEKLLNRIISSILFAIATVVFIIGMVTFPTTIVVKLTMAVTEEFAFSKFIVLPVIEAYALLLSVLMFFSKRFSAKYIFFILLAPVIIGLVYVMTI